MNAMSSKDPASSKAKPNLVTVMGFGPDDVLFESDKVRAVQWRNSEGELIALLARIRDGIWGFSMKSDPDWAEVARIYGNCNAPANDK